MRRIRIGDQRRHSPSLNRGVEVKANSRSGTKRLEMRGKRQLLIDSVDVARKDGEAPISDRLSSPNRDRCLRRIRLWSGWLSSWGEVGHRLGRLRGGRNRIPRTGRAGYTRESTQASLLDAEIRN